MRGLHKSKRVSWAADVNLCQVKLFLSEECPSQVGLTGQDHLQAKAAWLLHSTGTGSDDFLPPGFEGSHPTNQSQINLSEIPLIKWSCPPRIVMNSTWLVAAGDESKEVEILNQREMRVLEAVYPRPSAIPSNPTVSADVEDFNQNDWQTPLIPITPIEDEDAAADTFSDSIAQHSLMAPGMPSPSSGMNPAAGMTLGVDTDVVAAASAAFGAVMNSNEQGNLIDHDLLIKILSNPKLIEKLVTDHGPSTSTSMQNMPNPRSPPVAIPDPPVHINRQEMITPLIPTSGGSYYPQPSVVGVGHVPNPQLPLPPPPPPPGVVPVPSHQPSAGAPPKKDINYYKSLIQQHGGERQDSLPQYGNNRHSSQPGGGNQESLNNPKSRDSKPRIMKPCIYFNSSRGCRHGSNCSYQHDESYQRRGSNMGEGQSAKRMKMDREITAPQSLGKITSRLRKHRSLETQFGQRAQAVSAAAPAPCSGIGCKSFECLNKKKLSRDCVGCFDLASNGYENQKFVNRRGKTDFTIDNVL